MQLENVLASQTSPYLRQHQDNPVAWQIWSEQTLALARQQQKPVLLSIGYAACHWCHVMAHESFEDPKTAALMNDLFVNIKVDKEERPDLDRVYQLAHQLIQRRGGGWPLTVFLDPVTQLPFYVGTYFPATARFGLPDFKAVLRQLSDFYHHHQGELQQQQQAIRSALSALQQPSSLSLPDYGELAGQAKQTLLSHLDTEHGGWGGAPKFPLPYHLMLLRELDDPACREALSLTLRRMANGGIYDQLGGGFFRYSVDERWEIPHFEKMLYDNGPLLSLYAVEADSAPQLGAVARETADFLLIQLQHHDGGFYASLDADSDGGEGSYYLWTPAEVAGCLREPERELAEAYYNLDEAANFEGRWHLQARRSPAELAARRGQPEARVRGQLRQVRQQLLTARRQRRPPALDNKILVGWNALAIIGLIDAADVLEEAAYLEAAHRALVFIESRCVIQGRLMAGYQFHANGEGEAVHPAFLADHALLMKALYRYLQQEWRSEWAQWLVELTEECLRQFYDPRHGGFFFTAADQPPLIIRDKPYQDNAEPSSAGVATWVLVHLGHLFGRSDWLAAAEKTLANGAEALTRSADGCYHLLAAYRAMVQPPAQLLANVPAEQYAAHRRQIRQWGGQAFNVAGAAGPLPGATIAPGQLVLCRGTSCQGPFADWDSALTSARQR